jgi:hypothetical protein
MTPLSRPFPRICLPKARSSYIFIANYKNMNFLDPNCMVSGDNQTVQFLLRK